MKLKTRRSWAVIAGFAILFASVCSGVIFASGAQEGDGDLSGNHSNGTILWLSNLSSGIQYDTTLAYCTAICNELGYKFSVIYGDPYNDAAGNLASVKNGMTPEVVGLMTSQDGGIASIMEDFPDLYVAGYNTDMGSVYRPGGENAAILENEHFLGTICDGFADGAKMGKQYAEAIIRFGYKRITVIQFPAWAYPGQAEASKEFYSIIKKHNTTADASGKIEIIGDPLVLEFQPLPESYFLEDGHDDIDCIASLCAGILFVYPTLVTAISNGVCSPDTQMITGGFDDDESIVTNVGGNRIISWISFSPAENPAFALALLDNAINGVQYPDWSNAQIDGYTYTIDSTEDINNVMTKSMAGTGNVGLAQLSIAEVKNLCVRFNPDATYADLVKTFHSEQLSVDALRSR